MIIQNTAIVISAGPRRSQRCGGGGPAEITMAEPQLGAI